MIASSLQRLKHRQLLLQHRLVLPNSGSNISSSGISRHYRVSGGGRGGAAVVTGLSNVYNNNSSSSSSQNAWTTAAAAAIAATATAATTAAAFAYNNNNNNNDNNNTSLSSLLHPVWSSLTDPILSSCYSLRRNRTVAKFEDDAEKEIKVRDVYDVNWKRPLGEGGFGSVFSAVDRTTGQTVALKQMSKKFTDNEGFQREMDAFLHLRESGGHPNICQMYKNFDEGNYYYMSLDLISGGEMFDHLIKSGPYSEIDAARLIREVCSALAFMHGIGMVHGDMKPENIMLSTKKKSDSAVKLIDFGCTQITTAEQAVDPNYKPGVAGLTVAYCPPEILSLHPRKRERITPAMDMWALGIILHIMLVGCNPYDLRGDATDKVLAKRVREMDMPKTLVPNSKFTKHLSESALDLIRSLLNKDSTKRITAQEMLQHPWVRGITASDKKMNGSDERLSKFRVYKSSLEARVFADIVEWSEDAENEAGSGPEDITKRTSLIERSFRKLDESQKGYITAKDLQKSTGLKRNMSHNTEKEKLSLTAFETLISDNMKDKYYSKDEIVFKEGEPGDFMLFINSGLLEVSTKDGFQAQLKAGQFVGEGALISDNKLRSGTLKCLTPVHAIEISREYFDKYLAESEHGLNLKMREKDKQRALARTQNMLKGQKSLKPKTFQHGEMLYRKGDPPTEMYLIESGKVDMRTCNIQEGGYQIATLYESELLGVDALLQDRSRNCCAVCSDPEGCLIHSMNKDEFCALLSQSNHLQRTTEDFFLRKEFQKAVTHYIQRDFPTTIKELRVVFNEIDLDGEGELSRHCIEQILKKFDSSVSEDVVTGIINTLDIDNSGSIDFEEFVQIFDMEKKKRRFSKTKNGK